MKRSFAAVAAACSIVAACAHPIRTRIGAVDAAYMNELKTRLTQYNQTEQSMFAEISQRLQTQQGKLQQQDVDQISEQIFSVSEVHGRELTLSRFVAEGVVSGQIGLMWSWWKNRYDELVRNAKTTDLIVATFQIDAKRNPNDAGLAQRYTGIIAERGIEKGVSEELLALSNDLQGYARDYGAASALDQQDASRRSAELQAQLSAPQVTVQAPPPDAFSAMRPPVFTQCMPMGPFVNCMTH